MHLTKLFMTAIVAVALVFGAAATQAQQIPNIRVAYVVPQGNWASDQKFPMPLADFRENPPGRGIEATVRAGDDAARVAYGAGNPLDPVGDDLRVFHIVGGGVDHTRDQHLVRAQTAVGKMAELVRVSGIGEGQHKASDVGFHQLRQDLLKRHVQVVRTLVVAPTDVKPHRFTRKIPQAAIDRGHHGLDELEKIR